MRPVRALSLLLAALPFAPIAVPPASATPGAAAFTGTANISCFGCGTGTGTASLLFSGAANGPASASYTYNEPPSTCPVSGTANGTVSGAVNGTFTWTRVGALAVIGGTYTGFATFQTTSPPGNACGAPNVTATVTGVIYGDFSGLPSVTVPPQCSDGVDDDLDGRTDYPSDPGCTGSTDDTENSDSTSCSTVGPVCVQLVAGTVYQTVEVRDGSGSGTTHHVVARVDIYTFSLPTGGTATLPCVTLGVDTTTANPCAQAGGTNPTLVAVLVDRTDNQPSPGTGNVLASVRICNALLTATVAGIGVQNVPAYTIC